jgi:hypothetical protein
LRFSEHQLVDLLAEIEQNDPRVGASCRIRTDASVSPTEPQALAPDERQ